MSPEPTAASTSTRECLLLLLAEEKGMRCSLLKASTYSLGRDPKNSIILPLSKSVSRCHAMLLRIPGPNGKGHRYRIVDGDIDGKPSTNGVIVNGDRHNSYALDDGDIVMLGEVKLSYQILTIAKAELEAMVTEGVDIPAKLLLKIQQQKGADIIMSAAKNSLPTAPAEELSPTLFFKKKSEPQLV
ncbi:MAG: FHA domain-containing protein [Acaryochloridaceae cyanobacterium SU_2_1]|nr:FHA domain-containing protein [Acaryochloridaceae cyanobacterium SU_2_1]NJM95186.1 FHA domain-containing protein [Acaryochloridaceae cyanobacterium CSU_5_19]